MRPKHAVLLALLALAWAAPAPALARDPDPPDLKKVIFDRAGFVRRLHPKTLVFPAFMLEAMGAPVADAEFSAAMKALGPVPGVTFVELPDQVSHPAVRSSVRAHYPPSRVDAEQSGHADFLVMIGRTGRVAALYCTYASDDSFAVCGANALVQWTFVPASLEGQPVPVLVLVRMEFKVILM
jgi:hypothetical protein